MRIVEVGSDDVGLQRALGELTAEVYRVLHPEIDEDGYAEELADVAGRVAGAVVLAALGDAGELLGGVTFVPGPSSPYAEWADDAPGIRMLAVAPGARRRGVGRALVLACLERAGESGHDEVVLHSTPAMVDAHRLYLDLGFERDEALDHWIEDLQLLGFRFRQLRSSTILPSFPPASNRS